MAVLLAPQDSVNMAQAQWLEMFNGLIINGVMSAQLNTYTTTVTSGLGISVASGRAIVQGFLARSDAAVPLTCATADPTNPRIDRAVLHCDLTAHTLTVQLLTGTPGASPAPPTLTQSATVWEISLYQIRVNALQTTLTAGSLTDERPYCIPAIPVGGISDSSMFNQKVNRSGDTMTGGLVAPQFWISGGPSTGEFDFETPYMVYRTPLSGGSALAHVFQIWNGSAARNPLGVGSAATALPALTDIADTGALGIVAGQTTAGSFGVPTIVAQALGVTVSTTSDTIVLSYTTGATGLYRVNLSFYLSQAGNSTITAFVKYFSGNDGTNNPGIFFGSNGAINNVSLAKGEWGQSPIDVYALTGTVIAIHYQDTTGTPADKINCLIERLS